MKGPARVRGYLARDGTFYSNATAARLHDETNELGEELRKRKVNPEALLLLIDELLPQFHSYITVRKIVYDKLEKGSEENEERTENEEHEEGQPKSKARKAHTREQSARNIHQLKADSS
jgi:hypothetical protein